MLPVFATALAEIAIRAVQSLLPNTPQDKLDLLRLQIEQQAQQNVLLTKQMEINQAEAANPNRTWATWRELLGYVMVTAVTWQWILLPVVATIALAAGHPLDVKLLPEIDIVDCLYLMCGMLGMDAGPIIANKFRGVKK